MTKEKTIFEEADESWEFCKKEIARQIKVLNGKDEKKAEAMREEIQEKALEVGTKTDFDGSKQYMILLGTGGPAMRIYGELNEHNEPETAEYQFQNWFTPWTTAEGSRNDENLLEYTQQFCFGWEV